MPNKTVKTVDTAVVADPEVILQILRISRETAETKVYEAFLKAFVNVNAGRLENKVTQARAAAATRDWLIDGILDSVVVRFCVLEAERLSPTS